MKIILVIDGAELRFDLTPPDLPFVPGATVELPLGDGEEPLTAEVRNIVISYPASHIVLVSTPRPGTLLKDLPALLERSEYISNVTLRLPGWDEDDL
ncbi:hypothetical protein GTY65_24485 [Streptomyces sp. SID8379]|uniref:hypothetical protein n=1 Tax=unclassified Streptomyces TaxID=2593676 RepID=UPI00035DB1CD|nr:MULTISPECIES: hypothetical protein [unclassified Streptomyces]MYW67201.1 hypothetical protein [Streptomyces sp. SID8379]